MKFKPPKKIKVGGIVYKVRLDPRLYQNEGMTGVTYGWRNEIVLDPDNCGMCGIVHTMIHEIIHTMEIHLKPEKCLEDPRQVDRVASAIMMLVADNPGLVKEIVNSIVGQVKP
jgi:hypothetical protein